MIPNPSWPRRWLILAHAYNVDGRAESVTITDKMPHLVSAGVAPVVLSSCMGAQDRRYPHQRLLPWGPAGLRFDLRHILQRRWGRTLAYQLVVGSLGILLAPCIMLERWLLGLYSQWSWALPAALRGWRMVRAGEIDLLYSTGGVASAHLAAHWIHRLTGCPWIAEVHDPLVVPGQTPQGRQARFLARIEAAICRHASVAWWFTQGAWASAHRRHPELAQRGMVVLPGAEPPTAVAPYSRGPHCILGHFGSLSNSRSLLPVVLALAALLKRQPALRDLVRLEVYGGALDPQAQSARVACGLEAVVCAMGRLEYDPATGLSGRDRAAQRMQQVDVLLIVHGQRPDCVEYIPSKLYDYFWARRPVLALTHRNPQFDALVQTHGGWVAPYIDPAAIEAALLAGITRWQQDQLAPSNVPALSAADAVQTILSAVQRLPHE
jgi:hypothetical protein